MSGLPESGHDWAIYEDTANLHRLRGRLGQAHCEALLEAVRRNSLCVSLCKPLPTLLSDGLLIRGGTALYHPAATLQVERSARDVAGGYTLPVCGVISEQLAIYP
jgi:hypothetical protein